MNNINAYPLIRERQQVLAEARSIIDHAEAANRDFTEDEQRRFDKLESRARHLASKISNTPPDGPLTFYSNRAGGGDIDALLSGEVRAIDLTTPDPAEYRTTLNVGADAAGGHTVPRSFVERLYQHIIESSSIRQTGVEVIRTDGGEELRYPKTSTHAGESAAIVPEGEAIGESNPEFSMVVLGSFKYGHMVRVTSELLQDTGVDLQGYLAREGGRALGNSSGVHFIGGSGVGQPQGLVPNVTVGKEAAATDALTADELIELYFAVLPEHRARGTWLMNDRTWSAVRKLKDGEQRYLVGDLGSGADARLLGRPVVIDPNVPEVEADARPILFGDHSSAYVIREAGPLRIERSDEIYFANDLVAWRFLWRLDGRVLDPQAVKCLHMADGS